MPYCVALAMALSYNLGSGQPSMQDLIRFYTTDRESITRYYDLPLSGQSLKRREDFDKEWTSKLAAIDFDRLNQDEKVDWILLRNHVESDLRDIQTFQVQYQSIKTLLPFADTIVGLEQARWTLDSLDPEKSADTLDSMKRDVRKQIDVLKTAQAKDKQNPASALKAARTLSSLRDVLRRWFDHYNGYKPVFSWWCKKPYDALVQVLEEYEKLLKEDIAGQKGQDDDPLVGDPIGRERLSNDLKREFIDYTPEELIQFAEAEYQWCLVEMRRASKEMGFGDDWKKAIEKTKQDHVEPGGQDDLIMAQGREAVEFVERHQLVTVEPLCKETWRVNMLTAEQQKNWPFAFYGGQHMATSYPVPEMDHASKLMSMRGNNKHFMRAVTFHELIPGHHLQLYMAERYRPYRQVFSTPFFVEGWALHWEMLMYDLGFPLTPENKVGMLFWRMHRCARIVVSLKYHLGEMTSQQMIDYLVDKVGHEKWTATSEVRRYVGDMYSPLYQCAYMIGGLQLRGLYKTLVPSKMTPLEFHDRVLHLGSIPMELVRVSMTGERLDQKFSGSKNLKASFK